MRQFTCLNPVIVLLQVEIAGDVPPAETKTIKEPCMFLCRLHFGCELVLPLQQDFNAFPCIIVEASAAKRKGPILQHPENYAGICKGHTTFIDTEDQSVPDKVL